MTPEQAGGRAAELDAADELAGFRDRFVRADPDLVYLDGNSLGRLPVATADRLEHFVRSEWGGELIAGYEHWWDLPVEVGDQLGRTLLGVPAGQTVVCDNTSVNLFKLALAVARRPGGGAIVTDDDNFPTDRYVLAEVARLTGRELVVVHSDRDSGVDLDALSAALVRGADLVSLSHTAYRSGALAPMAEVDRLAHDAGAVTIWDLSHSVGSWPVDLSTADAAVGCSYKYLNAGPGAPAWLWVRDGLRLANPIPGWWGTCEAFEMDLDYRPADGARRFLTGSQNIGGLIAVQEGVRLLGEAGLPRLRGKAVELTSFLIELVDDWLVPVGFRLASPRDPERRGAHVTMEHPEAKRLVVELTARGVVPDYRVPDRVRLGPAPLYTSFAEVLRGVATLRSLVG